MSNRKATFAKRQRETELKDHARVKEERRSERRSQSRNGKGPEIDWGEAINTVNTKIDDVIHAGPRETDGTTPLATSDSSANPPPPEPPPAPAPRRPATEPGAQEPRARAASEPGAQDSRDSRAEGPGSTGSSGSTNSAAEPPARARAPKSP